MFNEAGVVVLVAFLAASLGVFVALTLRMVWVLWDWWRSR